MAEDVMQVLHRLAREMLAENGVEQGPTALEVAERQARDLQAELERRTVTAQATGILMERFGLDGDAAAALLTRMSQEVRREVHVLAQDVVAGGRADG